jgi:hypothetical protein
MIRRPLRFDTSAGSYTWPRYQLEYDPQQPLILALIDLPGADYAFDQLGDRPAIKGVGTHTLRFLLVGEAGDVEAEMDEMRRVCYLGARGRLVLQGDGGDLRSCVARITGMPQITLGVRDRQRAPVILTFTQLSDFQGDEVITGDDDITTDPQVVRLNNPGDGAVYGVKLLVKGPFDGLQIVNTSANVPGTSTPWTFVSDRVAAAGEWLEIDAAANTVRFSADAGGTWEDDADNVVLQDGQVGLFALGAGDNDLSVVGAVGGNLGWEYRGTFV